MAVTRIVFGCLEEDLPVCPGYAGGNSWDAWIQDELLDEGDELLGVKFVPSYEAFPEWVGFLVDKLEFGGTAIFADDELEDLRKARAAWDRLRELCAARGFEFKAGSLIVCHDEE